MQDLNPVVPVRLVQQTNYQASAYNIIPDAYLDTDSCYSFFDSRRPALDWKLVTLLRKLAIYFVASTSHKDGGEVVLRGSYERKGHS